MTTNNQLQQQTALGQGNVELEVLTDFSRPFDETRLQAFNQVVHFMYAGNPQQMQRAHGILNAFKANAEAWTTVDSILMNSQDAHARFLALQILDEAINTRWKVLPDEQKTAIRSCIIHLVLQLAEDEATNQQSAHLITKLNSTLVSIVKQEWTTSWKHFISDICSAASQSQAKCENTLNILKLLSEEVFDFSKKSITRGEARDLKGTLTTEFQSIFVLCDQVISQAIATPEAIKASLIRQCLKTLQAFLSWIPLGYVFQTDLVEKVLRNLICPPSTRIEAIKLFTEISVIALDDEEESLRNHYKEKTCMYFCIFIEQISAVTKGRDLRDEHRSLAGTKSQGSFENFAKQVALAISSVLKQHLELIEQTCNTMGQNANIDALKAYTEKGLQYLIQCTNIPEDELFKICLEFWHRFSFEILQKTKQNLFKDSGDILNANGEITPDQIQLLQQQRAMQYGGQHQMHARVYPQILADLRESYLDLMAKPKEVLVVIDENGEAVEQQDVDVETLYIYEQMRETLIFLTNIDTEGMDRAIQQRLERITSDKDYFSFDRLNKLCWALGSISGTMRPEEENHFIVQVVKELLNLCEKKQGKSNKALVASDIMYVVGSFPNFLIGHWAFLKTVIKKLNEFMHERHPGVQDMASETFLKISQLTKHMFTAQKEGNNVQPYVHDLINMLPENLRDLQPHQQLMVYEGLGHMVSTERQDKLPALVQKLMSFTHSSWSLILQRAEQQNQTLMEPETLRELSQLIKTNTRAASSIGPGYLCYLSTIFEQLIRVYNVYSQCISNSVRSTGGNDPMQRPMKVLRRDILKLLQTYIEREQDYTYFNTNFLPTLQALVEDFSASDANARDPEVLQLFSTMIRQEGPMLRGFVSQILVHLLSPTLQMIGGDFQSYPEFREGFFKLVQAIISYCTEALLSLDGASFETILQAVIFGCKHEKPEVMELSLQCLQSLITNMSSQPAVCTQFFVSFYVTILKELMAVLTDCRHLAGFKLHVKILQQLVSLVDQAKIEGPINGPDNTAHQLPNNKDYVIGYLCELVMSMFPNLNAVQVETFANQFFNSVDDWKAFKGSVRDLMICMRSFSSQKGDFYEFEMKQEKEKTLEKERRRKMLVPGMGHLTSVTPVGNPMV